MTPALIAELRKLLERATPGPWEAKSVLGSKGRRNRVFDTRGLFVCHTSEGVAAPEGEDDAALIAAAVNSLPALLDRIERLERALGKWTCPRCNGMGSIAAEAANARFGENTRGGEGGMTRCGFCGGSKLHPIARAALATDEEPK